MVSKWRKVKLALGLNLCVFTPRNGKDGDEDSLPPLGRRSDVALLSPPGDTSAPASGTPRLSKSLSRSSSSKKTCSICLAPMRRRDGQAIFTAECSHSFHFQCIASNVKHGNRICPVCRAKWKEVPSSGPRSDSPLCRARITPVDWPQNIDSLRLMPPPRSNSTRNVASLGQAPEPAVFNDDEALANQTDLTERSSSSNMNVAECGDELRKVTLRTFTEVSAVPRSIAVDSFTVLLHLKAPVSNSWRNTCQSDTNSAMSCNTPRTPIDLVTVLDISGSMAGTKLALLKRAMGFVIQNLGPNDRLSVIAFSSTARRLFHLRRMSEAGRQQALQAVNSLVANGGTNIAEGLRKGAKIMDERRLKNPVASIILLSDGQDTYTVNSHASSNQSRPSYHMLLPTSLRSDASLTFSIPVHAFGFGMDHDALSMHSISEISGGTFSFIETEGVIQDAFAQCIGGLLSVVVKDLRVQFECIHPRVRLGGLKAGSYSNRTAIDQRTGWIDVGDLYADEERDFLVSVNVPAETSSNETLLLKVRSIYKDPLMKESVTLEDGKVRVRRTELAERADISIEVDRQRNRIQAADAMAQAQAAADTGDLTGAVTVLENTRKSLSETVSAKSHDQLCIALDAELKEMQERMASRHVYEASGRAYILSGMSSHSWQRATARGDLTDGSSLVQSYQTPSMTEMVTRSQATLLGSPSAQRILRPAWSFAAQPKPR